ncbi:MAG TPA: HEAT repeat domain-containing protein [Candidatus Obscuribacterales bacterium]
MDLNRLADVVETMILQHDYPGFEPRSLKLGLPEDIEGGPAKLFSQALGHSNVYVKLAALRWFQDHPGMAKGHINAIKGLLVSDDEWVRLETVKALERVNHPPKGIAFEIAHLLKDGNAEVRKEAAKACGKVMKRAKEKDERVLEALKQASLDAEAEVRWKAQKALRTLGELAS